MIIDADGHYTPEFHFNEKWFIDYRNRKNNAFSDAEVRVTELAEIGVDKQVLNPMGPSLGLLYNMDASTASMVMRRYNDFMRDLSTRYECFEYNIWLPLQSVDASLYEIDRLLDSDYFGIHVSDMPYWGFIPSMNLFWDKISKLGVPWYSHFTFASDTIILDQHIPSEFADLQELWKHDTWKFSLASIILGNVIDNYPDFKIIIAERDINWIKDFRETLVNRGFKDPMPYLQNNFWFTIEPESETFIDDAKYIGFDRLLFATDWPHEFDAGGANSMEDTRTVQQLNISDSDKEKIFFGNYYTAKNKFRN